MIEVRVQQEPFDRGAVERALMANRKDIGAIVSFTGYVRDENEGKRVEEMTLEHYPGMTEAEIRRIADEAAARWDLKAGLVIHRHGKLTPGEPIVLVAVAAGHRGAAFKAAEFLMDWLKTRAPFWKRETAGGESGWVAAKEDDDAAAARWKAAERSDPQS